MSGGEVRSGRENSAFTHLVNFLGILAVGLVAFEIFDNLTP